MRPDMKKVIREDGRHNNSHNWETRSLRQARIRLSDLVEYEEDGELFYDVEERNTQTIRAALKSAPIKPGRILNGKWFRKESAARTRPLLRYLNSRVGQRWDDVYSDISTNLPRNAGSVQGTWTYSSLKYHVTMDVTMVNGKPKTPSINRYYVEVDENGLMDVNSDFYVHPETRILCRTLTQPGRKSVRPAVEKRQVKYDDKWYLYRGPEHNETAFPTEGWYFVTWERFSHFLRNYITDKMHGVSGLESDIKARYYSRTNNSYSHSWYGNTQFWHYNPVPEYNSPIDSYVQNIERIEDKGLVRRLENAWSAALRQKRSIKKTRKEIMSKLADQGLKFHNEKVNRNIDNPLALRGKYPAASVLYEQHVLR